MSANVRVAAPPPQRAEAERIFNLRDDAILPDDAQWALPTIRAALKDTADAIDAVVIDGVEICDAADKLSQLRAAIATTTMALGRARLRAQSLD